MATGDLRSLWGARLKDMSAALETKAGHPPAVKAGGKRVVRKHHSSGDSPNQESKEWENSSPPKHALLISGAITRGDKDFPPAAAQVAHQKPQPGVEKLPLSFHIKQHIQQPRK